MLYDTAAIVAILFVAAVFPMLAGMGNQTAGKDPLYTLYLVSAWFVYLGWCWNRGGMTLGMRAWRVVLQNDEGSSPGWGRSLLRFGVSLVSAACFGLGFIWSLFEPQKRTWHDMASGTRLLWRPRP